MTTTSPSLNYPSRLFNMDPPLPPHPTTIVNPNPPATAVGNANAVAHNSHAESTCSSPRSQQTDNWDDPLPQVPGSKLRLMCSFGGHIIPKPHDKTLCYVGGETRIVVVDRNSSLSDVHARFSRSLLSGHKFTMKYQLPNEELDSLISVTTDEDLENMIEEYERIMSTGPAKPARIRLFLFPAKPETTASMGALLDDAKSETWFVDALNNSDLLNRGVSDSAVMDNLLEFDGMVKNDSCTNLEGQADAMRGNNQEIKVADQEVHTSTQDSPMHETNSSFDSGLSSPPMDNLPPVKVKVNDNTQGLDEQFSQMNVETNGVNLNAVPRDNVGRIISDDDRSDKSVPIALRKPPLPLQPVQRKFTDPYNLPSPDSKQGSAYNLQSPDSVASENSFTSAASVVKHSDCQDPSTVEIQDNRIFTHATDPRNNSTYPCSQINFQQVQEPAVVPSLQQNPQQQQQQFIQAPPQYIQHPGTGVMQVPSYYPMYTAAPTTQQPFHQQQMDQQYPVYLMPVNHAHQYNSPQQSVVADATVASSVRPANQATGPETDAEIRRTVQGPTPTYVHVPPNHFQQQYYGHVQPQRQTISTETDAEVHRTVQAPKPTYVQIAPNQFHQQYYGVSHVQPHAQTITSGHAATSNYSYNYTHPQEQLNYIQHPPLTPIPTQYQTIAPDASHDQMNYVQHPPPTPSQYQTITPDPPHDQLNYGQHPQSTPIPSQYQTITPATALLISQATSQLAADNASQQVQSSQPK